ncbi:MAG: hypothetical protein SGI86_04440 [Deltaproteobacteria bacterium]|nr:hypothetical protein [Deltaproteobacteria bacterium]
MSHESEHTPHQRSTEEASAGINMKIIVGVGIVSVVIFTASVIVAYMVLKRGTAALEAEYGKAQERVVDRAEIGIVDNIHFDTDHRLRDFKERTSHALNNYGWSDRGKGLVRVPIGDAVAKVISDNNHASPEVKPLDWPTAPTAPGTLEMQIRNLKPGQPVVPVQPAAAPGQPVKAPAHSAPAATEGTTP